MRDFQDLPKFERLKKTGILIKLQNCLEELLNCEVKLQCMVSAYPSKHNLFERPERTTYFEDEQTVTLLSRIIKDGKLVSLFGIRLHGQTLCLIPSKLLNAIANTLTRVMSDLYIDNNNRAINEIGDNLIKGIIASSIGKGCYNNFRIEYLIDYFIKIKSLTFEGTNLTTGIILTKSYHAFQGRNGESRDGQLSVFETDIHLIKNKDLNKRNWYLVDGKTSFFVFNAEFRSKSIYVANHADRELYDFLPQYLMTETLAGTDILLRVINPNHLSIITASGIEFVNLEGIWHVRDYFELIKKMVEITGMNDQDTRSLIFFIVQLSQKCKSSILFIPNGEDDSYSSVLTAPGTNMLGSIHFSKKMYTNTLLRIMSSDGVTVISKDGILLKHGSIVKLDMPPTKVGKLLGTGQVATQKLSDFGTAIKISSDGTVTIINTLKHFKVKF